jgi:hypothetical protein
LLAECEKRKLFGVRALRRLLGLAVAVLAAASACSGPAPEPPIESEPTRIHVVATVERQSVQGHATSEELAVLLSVLKIPQSVNEDRLLRLMGLRTDLPPLGSCEVIDLANRASPSLSSVERIEFLDVGEVSVTSGKRSMRLARQAFPTVTDFIAGVVYTSRDKNADLLPLEEGLSVRARGIGKLKPFTVDIADRPRLDKLFLDGAPLSTVNRLAALNPFELRWEPGVAGDVLWLEVGANSGHKVVSCAFDDTLGSARVPGGMTDELGETRLSLHRLHHAKLNLPGLDAAEIHFDSRLTQPVLLQ